MIFWFGAIFHNRIDEVIAILNKYIEPDAKYIIGLEHCTKHQLTNGEHMHFAVDMTEANWLNYVKKFTETFELAGKNNKKGLSHYGRIKKDKVRDETKFMSYTLKDGNYVTKNIEIAELQILIDGSYKKQDYVEELQDYLDKNEFLFEEDQPHLMKDNPINIEKLEMTILKHYIENNKNKKTLLWNKLQWLTLSYMQSRYRKPTISQIYHYMKHKY